MEELVQAFCEMVRIPSKSGSEGEFLDWLAGRLRAELGATCERDDYGNLIARVPGRGCAGPAVLLAAHADTVKPGVGIEPVVEGGVIRSRGDTVLGADDKAGIAAIWFGVKAAQRHPPVEIVITREEEVGLLGAKHLDVSRLKAEMGFVFDGEELNDIVIGGPSHFLIDVTVRGKAVHAAMEPEKGISAIKAAARAIAKLPEGRIDPETTANVGVIRGGEVRNAVPGKAVIQAECRSLNHERAVELAELYKQTFEQEAAAVGARAEVNVDLSYRAVRLAEDEPVVELAKQAISRLGISPKPVLICGGTDASILNTKGIRCAVLGMGSRSPHSPEEHIYLEDLEKAAELARLVLELACQAG